MILQPFSDELRSGRPNNVRWIMFAEYLRNHGDEYVQVLTTDIRDVVIQGDIFSEFADRGSYLGYALEADNIRGDKSGDTWNYDRLVKSYGKNEADKLLGKQVICNGTIIGTVSEMRIFIDKFIEYLPGLSGVNDQPTEAYIIYNNLVPIQKLLPIDCQTGAIFTAALYNDLHNIETNDGYILRGDGLVPAVVHQYDRSPKLTRLVDEVYRAKDFQPDNRFTDPKSASEQLQMLAKVDRFDDALKFWTANSFNSTDFTNNADILIDTLFTAITKNLTADVEMLEIAIQQAIMRALSVDVTLPQISVLYNYTNSALKSGRTVNSTFKIFVANYLSEFAKIFIQNGNIQQAAIFIEAVNSLNITLSSDIYLVQAEVYRRLNRNEESLAAYRKALNLK